MNKLLLFSLAGLLLSCQNNSLHEYRLDGYAQGSTFHITWLHEASSPDYENSIDSLLRSVDASVSTYKENSLLSRLNRGDTIQPDMILRTMLERSEQIYQQTNGAFDPSIGKLVRFWGFGPDKNRAIDSSWVDSLLNYTGFGKIKMPNGEWVLPTGFDLDFNAIAQGYTVDLIGAFLESKGVKNYLVEVGGEVRCRGKNMAGEIWRIGIDKPTEKIDQQDRFQVILKLDNAALATSGNYRKFWTDEKSGVRYAHTINPKTGFPARNSLLSVSVIASDATTADAYATAFMVMGAKLSIQFLQKGEPSLEAYLIMAAEDTSQWNIYQTQGFENKVLNN